MIYYSQISEFIKNFQKESFKEDLIKSFEQVYEIKPSKSEISSWINSLKAISNILKKLNFENIYIFLEYKMPSTSRRADVILFGFDKNSCPVALIIELKQWSKVEKSTISETVMVSGVPVLHPSIQVKGYCEYLKYYHKAFSEDNFDIRGCIYLHNLEDKNNLVNNLVSGFPKVLLEEYPIFLKNEEDKFLNFLKGLFINRDIPDHLVSKIINPIYSPSTKLLDFLVKTIESNFEWKLLDEQRVVYNAVIDSIKKAKEEDKKSVIIVSGGPGTGKSVLSIQLLAFAAKLGYKVIYTTGSKAYITVLQALIQNLSNNLLPIKDIFVLSKDVAKIGAENKINYYDLVIYDEGHRLWDYRRNIFNNINKQLSDTPMIEEIINSTKVLCIFLDENQTVRANEIGSVNYIEENCKKLGIEPIKINLNIQFRCSGSNAYIDFIDSILWLSQKDINLSWKDDKYEFEIFNKVEDMYNKLKEKISQGYKCRLVAGFCWRWSEPDWFGNLPHDIKIGNWSAPWIEKTGKNLPPSQHQYYKWAMDDSYFEQVGSIYSVQGFEFDYVGVIFGNDLVIQNWEWKALLENNKDNQFKKDLKVNNQDALKKLKNIYRILMTRGMKGTYVYFIDEETKNYFLSQLSKFNF